MKKIIAIILTFVMLIPFAVTAAEASYDPQVPFSDTKPGAWYYSAIKYCAKNSLLKGMSDTYFGLNTTVSRAMFVQALANMEGVTSDMLKKEPTPFTDVKSTHWYYTAVEWARQNGIVGGMTDTTFAPNGALTRQQMARLFCQYAKYKGMDTDASADLSVFTDNKSIHSWALEGMTYCVGIGLFVGDNGKLTPTAKATRAQLAVVLYKFDYMVKYGTEIPDSTDADALLVEAGGNDRLVIFGDSMAQRLSKKPLQTQLSVAVTNYGVGGEGAGTTAMRQGGMAFYATPMTIPADRTPVRINFVTDDGDETDIGYFGDGVSNEFTVAGVEGKVAFQDGHSYFTRNTEGDEVVLTKPTRVITKGMESRRQNDILVIWTGSNNHYGADEAGELIAIIEDMVDYAGAEEYIVIGLTSKAYMSEVDGLNANLEAHFGEHFVDLRAYMMTEQCLIDNGITPTEADYDNLAMGEIPASLLADSVHGTDVFYNITAEMVAERIKELGYLS